MRPGRLLFPAVALLAWFGCATEPEVNPDQIVVTIGPAGGTLVSRDSLITVTIPAGAVSAPTNITIHPIEPGNLPSQFAGMDIDGAWELGPSGMTFAQPITVTVVSNQVVTQSDSSIQFIPEGVLTIGGSALESLDSVRLEVRGDSVLISGQLSHFSPVVKRRRGGTLTATLSNVPAQSEVGLGFQPTLAVTWTETIGSGQTKSVRWATADDESPVTGVVLHSGGLTALSTIDFEARPPFACLDLGPGVARVQVFLYIDEGFTPIAFESFFLNKSLTCIPATPRTLTVATSGTGSGTVTSDLAGISCPGDCSESFPALSLVTLTATAAAGSSFIQWSDDCFGLTAVATVRLYENLSCTARFELTPTVSGVQPTFLVAADGGTLTVNGANFVQGASTIQINGVAVTTTFVSSTQLTTNVSAGQLSVGNIDVTVATPGFVTSTLVVVQVRNRTPVFTNMSPSRTMAGGPDVLLTITGTDFAPNAVVILGTTPLSTSAGVVAGNSLHATIPASLITTPGTVQVVVRNPGPGTPTSSPRPFQIAALPTISSLQPPQVTAGGSDFTLTINGANFIPGGTSVTVGGTDLIPTTVSDNQITVTVPANKINGAGTLDVTVTTLLVGTSAAAVLEVQHKTPVFSDMTPLRTMAGGPDVLLTITGTDFAPNAVVIFGTTPLSTSAGVVAGNSLHATIPASLITTPGTVQVVVRNPGPGTPTSSPRPFQIAALPTISSLQPSQVTAGSGDVVLTINGANFIPGATTVMVGGTDLVPTSATDNQITVTVPASKTNLAGTLDVSVTVLLVGTSPSATLTVGNPVPVLTSLNPSSVLAGSPIFLLEIFGTSIAPGARVFFGATEMGYGPIAGGVLVEILPSQVATPGTVPVTVVNPGPGGGTSNVLNFQVTSVVDPCNTFVPLQVGVRTDGTLNNNDCTDVFGTQKEYYDIYTLTTTQIASTIQFTGTPSAYVLVGTSAVTFADIFSFNQQEDRLMMVPPGTYYVVVASGSGTNPERTYSIQVLAAPSTDFPHCDDSYVQPGIGTLNQALEPSGDCSAFNRFDPGAGQTSYDYTFLNVGVGQTATVTMASPTIDSRIFAICTNGIGQTRTFTDDNSGGGTTARLAITSTNYESCRVEFTSTGSNRGIIHGPYTVNIQ